MMRNFVILLSLMVAHSAYAVPLTRGDGPESDEIEQELIRHHHAADGVDNVQTGNAAGNNAADDAGSVLDDESLYDFTVADVLADIIYELKKNPELLEQLIDSERQKVERRIQEMNLAREDSYGDDLSDFQKTAEQLQNEPKRVEKKAGRSGMPVLSGTKLDEKRAQEVIDNNYAHNDVSQEARDFQNFLNMPQEGGKAVFGDDGSRESSEEVVNDDSSQSDDSDSQVEDTANIPTNGMTGYEIYQWMRHLPGFQPLQNVQGAFPQYQRPLAAGQNLAPQAGLDTNENSLSSLQKPEGKQNSQATMKLS